MKKFIRSTLLLVLILGSAIVILGLMEPVNLLIVRSQVIRAPKSVVFEQIVNFKNWPNWTTWDRMDSSMKKTYFGTDGQPGSSYTWEGNDKVGSGQMVDSSVNGTQLDYILNIIKPVTNTAVGYLKAEDTAGMTKVTWAMTAHTPFPLNAMNAFVNMDKMLGGDFEAGLANMKQYVESHTIAPANDIQVKEVDYPAHIFEGMRTTVAWSGMAKFFADSYSMLGKDIAGKINGPATGLYFVWDTLNMRTDAAAVFPVSDTSMPVKGTTFMYSGPARAVMAVEKGGYGSSAKYHNAIMSYMAGKGQKHSLVIEEYITGPAQEPDSNKWVTNIYYLIQ